MTKYEIISINEFFWEAGQYTVEIIVEYGKQNVGIFCVRAELL